MDRMMNKDSQSSVQEIVPPKQTITFPKDKPTFSSSLLHKSDTPKQ
ncbi:hypothetical protein KBB05_04160 [Patescibacteria group bacterium]|nr:hypothetical protein [Patescibacteria group bacterium]